MTKFTSASKSASCAQKVARKHLKTHLRRIRNKEYSRLREMVPSIAKKDRVSKVTVIEEAVKYIDELHKALLERFNTKGSEKEQQLTADTVKQFIHSTMPSDFFTRTPLVVFEKQQTVPSYLKQTRPKVPSKLSH